MRAINFSKMTKRVRFQGRELTLRLEDFTWADMELYAQLTNGQDLMAAFVDPAPRAVLPAVFLHDKQTNSSLKWPKFIAGVNPYRDLEILVGEDEDDDEVGDDQGETADPEGEAGSDPEA